MPDFRNVKVTAVMASGLAQDPPRLDSLCELIMASKMKSIQESRNGHRHQYEIRERGFAIDTEGVGKIPIPIARRFVDGLPIPLCSDPICGEAASDSAHYYTSAFPTHRVASLNEGERTKIMQSGGRFKSFRLPLRVRHVDRIVWFAVLREKPQRLRYLLRRVDYLGKKTSQGFGRVSEWIVEPFEHDFSWYAETERGPLLMRPLPVSINHPSGLWGMRQSFGGCVGPYWQRDFWREIYEPC